MLQGDSLPAEPSGTPRLHWDPLYQVSVHIPATAEGAAHSPRCNLLKIFPAQWELSGSEAPHPETPLLWSAANEQNKSPAPLSQMGASLWGPSLSRAPSKTRLRLDFSDPWSGRPLPWTAALTQAISAGVLLSHNKGQDCAICWHMEESRDGQAEWSQKEKNKYCILMHMCRI